jgi:hypothetical protein
MRECLVAKARQVILDRSESAMTDISCRKDDHIALAMSAVNLRVEETHVLRRTQCVQLSGARRVVVVADAPHWQSVHVSFGVTEHGKHRCCVFLLFCVTRYK